MAFTPTFTSFRRCTLQLIIAIAFAAALQACSGSTATVDEQIEAANGALARNDLNGAQKQCNYLADRVLAADTTITADQAANLAILLMKLSDARNDDDNVGVATQCLHHALSISPDSLRAFSQSLSLEDQRHLVLLWRIGVSIDNPVDVADIEQNEQSEADAAEELLHESSPKEHR